MPNLSMVETYQYRLNRYELALSRARWFGAAVAAAIAYLAADLVTYPLAQAILTVVIVLSGTFLGMHLFMFENSAFQLRWLLESRTIEPNDAVHERVSPYPIAASILRRLTVQAIGQIGIVVIADRLWATFPEIAGSFVEQNAVSLFTAYAIGTIVTVGLDVLCHGCNLLKTRRSG